MAEEPTSAVAQARAILGIGPEEVSDPRAVKRAYAVMLKRHRPDQDPEGFARVREAYDTLIAAQNLNRRMAEEDSTASPTGARSMQAPAPQADPVALPADPTVTDPVLPSDHPLMQAIARLDELVRKRTGGATLQMAARQVWTLAHANYPKVGLQALAVAFAEQPLMAGEVLEDRGVLSAFEHGQEEFAAKVVQSWGVQDFTRMVAFARSVLVQLDRGFDQYAALALRLADLIALRDPKLADDLLNHAFLHLPKEVREVTTMVEQRVELGRLLAGLPSPVRRFLWEAIDRDPQTPAPTAPAHVITALEQLPADHPMRGILRVVMPDLNLGHAWTRTVGLGAGASPADYGRRDSYREAREVDSEGSGGKFTYVAGFVLLMFIAAWFRQPSQSEPTYAPPPKPTPIPVSSSRPEFSEPPALRDPSSALLNPPRPSTDARTYGTRPLTQKEREALQKMLESGKIPVIPPRRPASEPPTPAPAK